MPSFTTFTPSTTIIASQVNDNFSFLQGNIVPHSYGTLADGQFNLGTSTAKWATVYANSLSGETLAIETNAVVSGTMNIGNGCVLSGAFGVDGAVNFTSTLRVNGAVTFSTTLQVDGVTTFNGNVSVASGTFFGFNTTTPSVAIHLNNDVSGIEDAHIRLQDAGDTRAASIYNVAGDLFLVTHGSTQVVDSGIVIQTSRVAIKENNVDALIINGGVVVGSATGGHLGFNTLNAGALYDDGSQVADFVFEYAYLGRPVDEKHYDYSMTTLEQQIEFTKENLHLSMIPGRAEMEEKGKIPLGVRDRHFHEAIETNFMYIKELHDRLTQIEMKMGCIK